MKKFLKVCFWFFWIIMLLVFHIGIYAGIEDGKSSSITIGIIFVVLWWGLTLGVSKIKSKINDNKQQKEQQKYNEQYISNIEINDERFGKVIIKHDTFKRQYDGEIKNVNFAGELLDVVLSCDDNVNLDKIIKNLKDFCDKAVLMKNRIYPELAEVLKDNDNFDEEDNLIEITEDFLREKFKFSLFKLYDEETVELWGSWDDRGDQDYSIKYNINKDDFKYELL